MKTAILLFVVLAMVRKKQFFVGMESFSLAQSVSMFQESEALLKRSSS
jgi:hypothetical protein